MQSKNQDALAARVTKAAEEALAEQSYVCFIDVLLGIRWLASSHLHQWRRGQVNCLEDVVPTKPSRVSEAMTVFGSWAAAKGLTASPAPYVARTPQRQVLRFSRSGDPATEALYQSHWVSQALPEPKRQRLAEKASRAPELVVIQPLNGEWKCHRCGDTGDFLIMENPGPACLRCTGLDDLEFLPAGDAALSRRAKSKSQRFAVVVRFSRSRRRYERQGLLVEPAALAEVQQNLIDAQRRA